METYQPNLIVTERDYQRLSSLIEWTDFDGIDLLWEELIRAQVVPPDHIPSDVVTMNSTVLVQDVQNGEEKEFTLVYPYQANASEGKVSILAPVGMALLGLKAHQTIDWPVPNGKNRKLKVVSVRYQPESKGHYEL